MPAQRLRVVLLLVTVIVRVAGSDLIKCDVSKYANKTLAIIQSHTMPPLMEDTVPDNEFFKNDGKIPSLQQLSAAFWNDYALLHGYNYTRVYLKGTSWGAYKNGYVMKAALVLKYLRDADVLLMVDSDVIINLPEQSIWCLLEHWGFLDSEASLMLSYDFDREHSYKVDEMGNKRLQLNSGVIFYKNSPRAFWIVEKWNAAMLAHPERWFQWPRDQGVLNMHVLPYLEEKDVLKLDCDEVNGFWWLQRRKDTCKGKYFTHATKFKKGLAPMLARKIAYMHVLYAHKNMRVDVTTRSDPFIRAAAKRAKQQAPPARPPPPPTPPPARKRSGRPGLKPPADASYVQQPPGEEVVGTV